MTSSSDAPNEGANGNGHAGRYYGQGFRIFRSTPTQAS